MTKVLKALAVTLGIMLWVTGLILPIALVSQPSVWLMVAWTWWFLGPLLFTFFYGEVT